MKKPIHFVLGFVLLLALGAPIRAALPTGVTAVPFYDVNKAGLSFAKDKQSLVGMWEVPGKPEHFVVLGYWGYIWTLYPDTTKTYAPGAIKDYTKKQVADFNTKVMKGWEQGALGGSFDPHFVDNHFFYIVYNKYATTGNYHGGLTPNGNDGPGAAGLVVVERWKVSDDYKALTFENTVFTANHQQGYGSSNMVFGKDEMMYVTMDSYTQQSWDSTIFMRKIIRIDVSKKDAGKEYSIPTDNPWFGATNPAVKKEVFAFGFRNTYSIAADYITGAIWGAEVGQGTWEEVNIIKAGKNYGWANGGDGAPIGNNSIGIEGPCSAGGGGFTSNSTDINNTQGVAMATPYSRTFNGRTYTCADFTNGTWSFAHSGQAQYGIPTALPGTGISCIILSPAFRGDPTSPFYGYHFVTDVASNYFLAVKEGVATPEKVGGVPSTWEFIGDKQHNGITAFSEDSYGNMYIVMLSSSSTGAFAWHDIYRISHTEMKPLATPRNQVNPVSTMPEFAKTPRNLRFHTLIANTAGGAWVKLPYGHSRVEIFNVSGKLLWTGKALSAENSTEGLSIKLPAGIDMGTLGVRFLP